MVELPFLFFKPRTVKLGGWFRVRLKMATALALMSSPGLNVHNYDFYDFSLGDKFTKIGIFRSLSNYRNFCKSRSSR